VTEDRADLRQVFDDLVRFETLLWNEATGGRKRSAALVWRA